MFERKRTTKNWHGLRVLEGRGCDADSVRDIEAATVPMVASLAVGRGVFVQEVDMPLLLLVDAKS